MTVKLHPVRYTKPSRIVYLRQIFRALFSLIFLKQISILFSYFIINFIRGRQVAEISKTANIHPTVVLRQGERIKVGDHCLLNHNNVLQAGKVDGKIIIGDYVHTGPNVMMFAYNHSYDDLNIPSKLQDYYDGDIVIEDDVWIGAGSIILAGVCIGKGSVIAAGSVVNKDIPSYVVAGGVPARVLKIRK